MHKGNEKRGGEGVENHKSIIFLLTTTVSKYLDEGDDDDRIR